MGIWIYPGALWAIYMWRQFRPPRLVAVTPAGLLTFSQSFLNNGPSELVASGPVVSYPQSKGGDTVHIGSDAIKLIDHEFEHLRQLIGQVVPASVPAPVAMNTQQPVPTSPAPARPAPVSTPVHQY